MPPPLTTRLFFALWPGDTERAHLHNAASLANTSITRRPVPRENLHQTLLFLGEIPTDRVAEVASFTDMVSTPAFTLRFGTVRYRRRQRMVWATPYESPHALLDLVAGLRDATRAVKLPFDEREYISHVTLVRNASAPAQLPVLAFDWWVEDYALVKSQGGRYEVVARGVLQ